MKIFIETYDKTLIPSYAHDGDAGMDLRAAEDVEIKPGQTIVIKTGIKAAMPKGIMMDIRPRSGLSLKTPLRVSNSPGTIDSGYRGEIGVIMTNTSNAFSIVYDENSNYSIEENNNMYDLNEKNNRHGIYKIKKGDRIAQAVFLSYECPDMEIISNVSDIEGNRGGGYGHSGIQ